MLQLLFTRKEKKKAAYQALKARMQRTKLDFYLWKGSIKTGLTKKHVTNKKQSNFQKIINDILHGLMFNNLKICILKNLSLASNKKRFFHDWHQILGCGWN